MIDQLKQVGILYGEGRIARLQEKILRVQIILK